MPIPRRRLSPRAPGLETGFTAIRDELGVPEGFTAPVLDEADQLVPRLTGVDRTELPLVTVDPDGSKDLDQAFCLETRPGGARLHYAIADVATFVVPGGLVDREAHERGMTLYSPDHRASLHPHSLSENRASLLAGQERPAVLWSFDLDADGELVDTQVERAVVRSRAQLTYADAQRLVDDGDEMFGLLARVGEQRRELAQSRGAVHLDLPDQEVDRVDGRYELTYRKSLPVELWNAELSLLTGMAAGRIMADAGRGIVRTLPPARSDVVDRLRATAVALGVDWPRGATPGEILGPLVADRPEAAALLTQAARLFRGAGYLALDGAVSSEDVDVAHAAIGSVYAHVTAPLRRLVDRYATETCLAITGGEPTPEWVEAELDELPSVMGRTGQLSGRLERAIVDHVEATIMADRLGDELVGVVVDQRESSAMLLFRDPPVIGPVEGTVGSLGDEVTVRVASADPAERTVSYELVG